MGCDNRRPDPGEGDRGPLADDGDRGDTVEVGLRDKVGSDRLVVNVLVAVVVEDVRPVREDIDDVFVTAGATSSTSVLLRRTSDEVPDVPVVRVPASVPSGSRVLVSRRVTGARVALVAAAELAGVSFFGGVDRDTILVLAGSVVEAFMLADFVGGRIIGETGSGAVLTCSTTISLGKAFLASSPFSSSALKRMTGADTDVGDPSAMLDLGVAKGEAGITAIDSVWIASGVVG